MEDRDKKIKEQKKILDKAEKRLNTILGVLKSNIEKNK